MEGGRVAGRLASWSLKKVFSASEQERLVKAVRTHPQAPTLTYFQSLRLERLVTTEEAWAALTDGQTAPLSALVAEHVLRTPPSDDSVRLAELLIAELVGALNIPQAVNVLAHGIRTVAERLPESQQGLAAVEAPVSEYARVVQDLVPAEGLLDRADELFELESFALGSHPYGWWQADPWAGKSALLASFALSPPSGIETLFYFVSRVQGRNTVRDCSETLLRQLCVLTGKALPHTLSTHERDEYRRRLLAEATDEAAQRGNRLVLIVDGLDEDVALRPFNIGPTIAGLLPTSPPPGLRIIVSSRPNTVTPAGHPLAAARQFDLQRSPHATEIRRRALSELGVFLSSEGSARDVIAAMTVAQSGLTVTDLHQLTRELPFRIDAMLSNSRLVRNQSTIFNHDDQPAFVLGHEELYAAATTSLDEPTMQGIRQQLHAWAAAYRDRQWPADTPAFLLRGYTKLLNDTQDTPRLLEIALDTARQERLLDYVGGDLSALDEIDEAHQLNCMDTEPNLTASYRLARRRATLVARGERIPHKLPAVWVGLGHPDRGKALFDIMPHARRDRAAFELARKGVYVSTTDASATRAVAEIASENGDLETASRLATAARHFCTDSNRHEVIRIACLIASLGNIGTACDTVVELDESDDRTFGLIQVGWAAVERNDTDAWRTVASRITRTPETSFTDMAALVQALDAGPQRTKALATLVRIAYVVDGFEVAHAIATMPQNSPTEQVKSLVALAQLASASPELDLGREVAEEATKLVACLEDERERDNALTEIAKSHSTRDEFLSTLDLLRRIADPGRRVRACADQVRTALARGWANGAPELVAEAAAAARQETTSGLRAVSLSFVAEAATQAGDLETARSICEEAIGHAKLISSTGFRSMIERDVAVAAARTGDLDLAESSAKQFKTYQDWGDDFVTALAEAGSFDYARRVFAPTVRFDLRPGAMTSVAEALIAAGRLAEAFSAALEAESLARAYVDPYSQACALNSIAAALAAIGKTEMARKICYGAFISSLAVTPNKGQHHPNPRYHCLVNVVKIAATCWPPQQTVLVAEEAIAAAGRDALRDGTARKDLTKILLQAGLDDEARNFTRRSDFWINAELTAFAVRIGASQRSIDRFADLTCRSVPTTPLDTVRHFDTGFALKALRLADTEGQGSEPIRRIFNEISSTFGPTFIDQLEAAMPKDLLNLDALYKPTTHSVVESVLAVREGGGRHAVAHAVQQLDTPHAPVDLARCAAELTKRGEPEAISSLLALTWASRLHWYLPIPLLTDIDPALLVLIADEEFANLRELSPTSQD